MAKRPKRPKFLGYLGGLLGVCLLILLESAGPVHALALALLMPGLSLLFFPPRQGPGRTFDRAVLLCLGLLLLAFVPLFYWPQPDWLAAAGQLAGIDLPFVLSLQPWISLELWMLVLGGFAWFYAAHGWPLNEEGRRLFFCSFSLIVAALAATVLWGELSGLRYPGAEAAGVFSYFPDADLTAGLLALGAVLGFAFAETDLRSRGLMPLAGFLAAGLCGVVLYLIMPSFGVGLLLAGLVIWYVWRLARRPAMPRLEKVGLPLVWLLLLGLAVTGPETPAPAPEVTNPAGLAVAEDSLDLWLEAPLSGVGLGNFAAVFPQYRAASTGVDAVAQPPSSLLWVLTEGGAFVVAALALLLWAYVRAFRKRVPGAKRSELRRTALVGLLFFVGFALVEVPLHRLGLAYLFLLLAALALPRPTPEGPQLFNRAIGRVAGGVLSAVGLLWLVAAMTGLPLQSKVAFPLLQLTEAGWPDAAGLDSRLPTALERRIAARPLDWEAHSLQGFVQLQRGEPLELAEAAFQRARFAEPVRGVVPLLEGYAWLPHDAGKAIAAWELALQRELPDAAAAFAEMVAASRERSDLMSELARLSQTSPAFRVRYLEALEGAALQAELEAELRRDPQLANFSPAQRTRILEVWILKGDLAAAEAFFQAQAATLPRAWWLRARVAKEKADFRQAVLLARAGLDKPELPETTIEDVQMVRVEREFKVDSTEVNKGAFLLRSYLKQEDYPRALAVCEALLGDPQAPREFHYWRAECLFHLQDYIESWFSLEAYVDGEY